MIVIRKHQQPSAYLIKLDKAANSDGSDTYLVPQLKKRTQSYLLKWYG